jgi:hypothetical protein
MGDNGHMTQGKRAGARAKRQLRPALLLLALGVTAAVVAWGYLVGAAIDFGTTARSGDGGAWLFLALAAVGAVMCLFLGLVLVARLARALGFTRSPGRDTPPATPGHDDGFEHGHTASGLEPGLPIDHPTRPGGRRAAR